MRVAVLVFSLCVCPIFADTEWLKLQSSNFEMYTTGSDKEARKTLEYFEQVRDFYMRIKSQQVTTRLPVTIIAFKNQKQYKPYAARETAAAYYIGDEQRDYIVLGGLGMEHYPIAVHEYMHLLIRHSGLSVPVWLNEGLAEVYSTMKPFGGQILLGMVPQGRTSALRDQWFPLAKLFSIDHDSSELNEADRTGVFYSQSWLLTHMLMLHDAYGKQFSKFVLDISANRSADGAFQRVYAKSVADVEKDLRAYYSSAALKGVGVETKLLKIEVSSGQPATEFETELTLAKLTAMLRRKEEAIRRLDALAKSNPQSWEVHEALAHLYWSDRDYSKASASFKRAVDLKPTSWKTYWDYARLSQGEPGVIDALKTALQMKPDLAEARMMLGFELYRAQKYQDAYDTLAPIRQVTPDRAASFFLVKAFSAMQIGKKAEAKSAAEMGKKYAKSAAEINQADSILEFLDRPARVAQVEERTAAPSASLSEREPVSVMRGALQEVECLGKEARIRVLSGNTQVKLLIRDPKRITIKNSEAGTVNFTCGPQKNTHVILEFRPKEDVEFKTLGDVVTLEFTSQSQ